MKTIAVFGATSAIASACARSWAGEGVKFFLVARDADKLGQVRDDLAVRGDKVDTFVMDLNDVDGHAGMLDACFEALGHVDVTLVAHGTLPDQGKCESDVRLAAQEFTNNGLSVIALLTGLAERMESQGSGCIAVISSVAGNRGRSSNYVYGAAKAAVTAFCSGLRQRLCASGVHVLTVKPGFVDTPMTQGLPLPGLLLASPERVANDITKAVERKRNTVYTPWFWRPIMLVIALIPEFVFKRLSL